MPGGRPINLVVAHGIPATESELGEPMTPTDVQALPVTIAALGMPIKLIAEDGSAWVSIAFDADSYTEGVDDDAVSLAARSANIGATWAIEISSSGGGTPVEDTGTVEASSFTIGPLDLTGLSPGDLTASYTEDTVEVATDTATLA